MKNEYYTTYMWQEQRGKPYYQIKSNDPRIIRKLLRRQSCRISCQELNRYGYQFVTTYTTPQKARQSLKRLTNGVVENDPDTGGFMVKTYPKMDKQDNA